jgi:hypothetical protein
MKKHNNQKQFERKQVKEKDVEVKIIHDQVVTVKIYKKGQSALSQKEAKAFRKSKKRGMSRQKWEKMNATKGSVTFNTSKG